jgi:hypothetical protein
MGWCSPISSAFGAKNNLGSLFVLCAAIIGISHNGYGYGKVGHQAVALIAEQNLTKSAHAKITDILGDMSMVDAAIWPDQIKHSKGWSHTAAYHYADTEKEQDYLDTVGGDRTRKSGDVIRALVKAEDILRDSESSDTQKRYALSFMIHLIGDLHQPLHEGYPEDKGGNEIEATYFGAKTNLHAIWDADIISNVLSQAKTMAKTFGFEKFVPMTLSKKKPTEKDVSDFVDQLRTPRDTEVDDWQNSYLLDWSKDSIEMREAIYSDWNGRSESYQKKYEPYLEEKILRAGYRLAGWLNAIMADKDFQPEAAQELRQTFTQKLGKNYGDSILLEPQSSSTSAKLNALAPVNFEDPCAHDDDDEVASIWDSNAPGL